MTPMVHAPCTMVNKPLTCQRHADGMSTETDKSAPDDTWERIRERIAKIKGESHAEAQWLCDRLGWSKQRVSNWKKRGVPASALPEIAAAIGMTINQILGVSDPPTSWPFETIDPARLLNLTARQAAMVEIATLRELERIEAQSKRDGTAG